MPSNPEASSPLLRQLHAAYVVAKKDALIYYLKPPVISFGIIFPAFFYLAFAAGRNVPGETMVPGITAMALFFTASAVGPLVTPWERQARTYERLVTSPASLWAILLGDTSAGALFGIALALIPLLMGAVLAGSSVASVAALAAGRAPPVEERTTVDVPFVGTVDVGDSSLVAATVLTGIGLGAVAFSALGVVMAARATDTPAQVMMLSNLVRLPLIFVSGVFIPLGEMPAWGQRLAPFSPRSYSADLIRYGMGGTNYFPVAVSVCALLGFAAVFLWLALVLHRRSQARAR